jgi:biopolymer transport protein ExbD
LGKSNDGSGSGVGAAIVVVMVAVLLVIPCVLGVLGVGFFLLRASGPVGVAVPAQVTTNAQVVATQQLVTINVAADSSLSLDGEMVDLEKLADRVHEINASAPGGVQFVVVAGPDVPYDAVQPVIDVLTKAGIANYIQTQDTTSLIPGAMGAAADPMQSFGPATPAAQPAEETVQPQDDTSATPSESDPAETKPAEDSSDEGNSDKGS